MIFYVNTDERGRIVAIASEGFHLGPDEIAAEFAEEYTLYTEEQRLLSEEERMPVFNAETGEVLFIPEPYETVRVHYVIIYDDRTIPLFKLEDGTAVARTQAEIDADYIEPETPQETNYEARIKALEDQLAAYEAAYAQGVQEA